MKTLAFAARKGGTGKSTLTAHLAVEAAKTQRVTLVDVDPQHTLSDWWDDRQDETNMAMIDVPLTKLAKELEKFADTPGLVMIDTPPNDSATIDAVIKLADLVVIPVKPSPNDLRGAASTVDMVKAAGKPFIFVLTQAIPNANISEEARGVLAAYGPVVPTVLYNRVTYAAAMTDGRTAPELDSSSKASKEVAALWKSVIKHLNKSVR